MKGLIDSSLRILCENIQSQGEVKYRYIKRQVTGQTKTSRWNVRKQEAASYVFVLFHGGSNWQISGKDPMSCSGRLEQEGTLANTRDWARSIQLKAKSPLSLSPPHCCSIYYSQYSEHSYEFFMGMSEYCSEKSTSIFHYLHLFEALVCYSVYNV